MTDATETAGDGLPILPFESAAAWEAWLTDNGSSAAGVWIRFAKALSGVASVSYSEALDGALCHGWIDGLRRSLDERHYLQRFTPRRPRSTWSQVNRARALELIAAGRMTPAGLREVERAQADGRWEAAYPSPRNATIPDDLRAALAADDLARTAFEALDGRNRYAILVRLHTARRPETRAKRLAEFLVMLREGRTLYR